MALSFIVTDPAIGHFLLSFGDVEAPTRVGLDERQRQGPAVLADAQYFRAVGPIVDRDRRGSSASLNSFRFSASCSASPDLSNAAPSLPRMRSPKPGAFAFGEIDQVLHRSFQKSNRFLGRATEARRRSKPPPRECRRSSLSSSLPSSAFPPSSYPSPARMPRAKRHSHQCTAGFTLGKCAPVATHCW